MGTFQQPCNWISQLCFSQIQNSNKTSCPKLMSLTSIFVIHAFFLRKRGKNVKEEGKKIKNIRYPETQILKNHWTKSHNFKKCATPYIPERNSTLNWKLDTIKKALFHKVKGKNTPKSFAQQCKRKLDHSQTTPCTQKLIRGNTSTVILWNCNMSVLLTTCIT